MKQKILTIILACCVVMPCMAQRLAAGYHSMMIKADGTLWAWGYNRYGQLGDGTTTDSSTPKKIMDGVVQVAAGDYYTLAIKSDGTLWAWGYNLSGQLGDGTITDSSTPKKIMDGVVQVAAGHDHTLAIKSDGTLWAWGDNGYGQLSDGTTTNSRVPSPQKIMDGVVQVAAGSCHTLAIKSDGTLWAWGGNGFGQLGDGTTTDCSYVPQKIMDGVVQVAAGTNHTLAIKDDGTLWAWGQNSYGQVGNGSLENQLSPVKVMEGVVAADGGSGNTVAIKQDGTLWGWGNNDFLGKKVSDASLCTTKPTKIADDAIEVSSQNNNTLYMTSAGTVYAFGDNRYGQLGVEFPTTLKPTQTTLSGVSSVVAGDYTSFAINTNKELYGWGSNNNGQVGDGERTDKALPVLVTGSVAQAVIGSDANSAAVKTNGTLWAWGNDCRKFGYCNLKPTQTMIDVKQVAVGEWSLYAVKSDGTLLAWGKNYNGQLGDRTEEDRTTPVQVMDGVAQVEAYYRHAMAVKTDGTLWAWGYNNDGQLGDGTTTSSSTPKKIMDGVVQVATGKYHTLAIKSDGTLWAWGHNTSGELGDGTITDSSTPKKIMDGVVQVAAGNYHTLAIKSDGTLWAWGWNLNGQLGDGTTTDSRVPKKIMDGVKEVSAGGYHVVALKTDGTVWTWGYNYYGQLGLGFKGYSEDAVFVAEAGIPGNIEFTKDGISYELLAQGKTATITAVEGEFKDVVIPSEITYEGTKYTVTKIGSNAVDETKNQISLSVSFPSTITEIEADAFKNCGAATIILNSEAKLTNDVITAAMSLSKNSLLYAPQGAVSESRPNMVIGGHAHEVVLTDETKTSVEPFHCPQEFTAEKISYTHDYGMKTFKGEKAGWETITLPFDVQTITHETKGNMVPFAVYNANSTDKPFWLYKLTSTGFVKADRIEAKVPYLISMPNSDEYSDEYRLSGKVTFSATNVVVRTTKDDDANGIKGVTCNGKEFRPTYWAWGTSDYFHCINAVNVFASTIGKTATGETPLAGSMFLAPAYKRPVHPFEGYFYYKDTAGSREGLNIPFADDAAEADAIEDVMLGKPGLIPSRGVYTLSGLRLKDAEQLTEAELQQQLPAGVYIVNGQKLVVGR